MSVLRTALSAGLIGLTLLLPDSPESPAGAASSSVQGTDHEAITDMLEQLYLAFGFHPGASFDEARFEEFFLDGASFVQPTSPDTPRAIDSLATFYSDFGGFVASARVQQHGIYEDILKLHCESAGDLAHAWVVFQPRYGDEPIQPFSRGLDSYQLVQVDGRWRVASTTLFERPEHPLPERFVK